MAVSAVLDLNIFLEKLLDAKYGLVYLCFVVFVCVLAGAIYYILNSGIISGVLSYLEYRKKNTQDILKSRENLLNEPAFEDVINKLEYHFNVEKIQKYLKFKHADMDLLLYIISCKDKQAAIRYFKSAHTCLIKDESNKTYKVKYTDKTINQMNYLGIGLYCLIVLGSLYPTFWVFYIVARTDEKLSDLPHVFWANQFLLTVLALFIAIVVLTPLIKPWKAKKFIELEKI